MDICIHYVSCLTKTVVRRIIRHTNYEDRTFARPYSQLGVTFSRHTIMVLAEEADRDPESTIEHLATCDSDSIVRAYV